MRVILATGVFAIGVELPKSYMYRQWKSLVVLTIPTMLVGWFICAGEQGLFRRHRLTYLIPLPKV
jgi:NhaP-type Na+/H+ or K+/H+ antiporter